MNLGALTKHAGDTIFSTQSPWRETVGYLVPGGERREILAVVSRNPIDGDATFRESPSQEFLVFVANDAELGVDRPRRGDFVDILDEEEGERWTWQVQAIETADPGRWQLRVEKRERYLP